MVHAYFPVEAGAAEVCSLDLSSVYDDDLGEYGVAKAVELDPGSPESGFPDSVAVEAVLRDSCFVEMVAV